VTVKGVELKLLRDRIGLRVYLPFKVRIICLFLALWNLLSKRSLICEDGPPLSLTSHGIRLNSVYLTIESVGLGRRRPSSITLWVDDEQWLATMPRTVLRLINRGLNVQLSSNYGPHTKYYPWILENVGSPLVTCDDDVWYPRSWLVGLIDAHKRDSETIFAYRARQIQFVVSPSSLLPYSQWPLSADQRPSFRNFITGVSGVIYPAGFLDELRRRGSDFLASTPRADDVWLHATAVSAGYAVGLVGPISVDYPFFPGTQESALMMSNVDGGGNDEAISETFDSDVVSRIIGER